MSPSDDDMDEMNTADEATRPPGGSDRPRPATSAAVAEFLADLRAIGTVEPPPPSADLWAMLNGAEPIARRRLVTGRVARRAALVAAALVVGSTAAAANHSLPSPAQRLISNVVNDLTPFHIDPVRHAPHVPVTPATSHPAPTDGPSEQDSGGPGGGEDSSSPGAGGGGENDSGGPGGAESTPPGTRASAGHEDGAAGSASTGDGYGGSPTAQPQGDNGDGTGRSPGRTATDRGEDAPGARTSPGAGPHSGGDG